MLRRRNTGTINRIYIRYIREMVSRKAIVKRLWGRKKRRLRSTARERMPRVAKSLAGNLCFNFRSIDPRINREWLDRIVSTCNERDYDVTEIIRIFLGAYQSPFLAPVTVTIIEQRNETTLFYNNKNIK